MNRFAGMLVLVMLLAGCGSSQPKGPTYNEALETYVNEMNVAERLMDTRDSELAKKDKNADEIERLNNKIEAQMKRVKAAEKVVDDLQKSK